MAKQQGRKPPKRKPAKPVLDADMRELALVLAESGRESGPDEWFALPWRSGWNAIELALAVEWQRGEGMFTPAEQQSRDVLRGWCTARSFPEFAYAQAERIEAATPINSFPGSTWEALAVAARCVQLMVANTAAGGHAYNAPLERLHYYNIARFDELELAALVLKHRCDDAIGPERKDLANERARRAFKIAWGRGLYHAAYSIKGT